MSPTTFRSVESLTLRGSLGEGDSQGSGEGNPGELISLPIAYISPHLKPFSGESQWSGSSSEEGGREAMLGENEWGEDFQDNDDEVELREERESRLEGRLSALYSYSGEEEGTLALEPGQQFR